MAWGARISRNYCFKRKLTNNYSIWYFLIKENCDKVKAKVIGRIPKTLKLTQISVDWVLQIISFKIAKAMKNPIHLFVSFSHPSSWSFSAVPRIYFSKGFFKISPPYRIIANKILIMVGFILKKNLIIKIDC